MNGAKTAETKIALQTFRKLRKSASSVRDNWVIRREQFVNDSIHSLSLLSDNGSNYKLRTQFSYRLALRIFESRFLAACNSLIYGFSYRLITFTDSTKPLLLEMQSISLLFNLFLLGSHNIRPTNNSPMFSYETHSNDWDNVGWYEWKWSWVEVERMKVEQTLFWNNKQVENNWNETKLKWNFNLNSMRPLKIRIKLKLFQLQFTQTSI